MELDASQEVPERVKLTIGPEFVAEVPWMPERRAHCQVFGHSCEEAVIEDAGNVMSPAEAMADIAIADTVAEGVPQEVLRGIEFA